MSAWFAMFHGGYTITWDVEEIDSRSGSTWGKTQIRKSQQTRSPAIQENKVFNGRSMPNMIPRASLTGCSIDLTRRLGRGCGRRSDHLSAVGVPAEIKD